MKLSSLVLTALIAVCAVLVNGPTVAAADEPTYTVVIKKVEVQATKKDGSSWDVDNGRPDLAVSIRNLDDTTIKAFTTKTKDDALSHEFDEPTTIKVRAGQRLEFHVIDKDLAVNDTIGKVEKEMTAEHLKSGKIRLEKFDQVVFLEIEVKKL